MIVERFQLAHFDEIRVCDTQRDSFERYADDNYRRMIVNGYSLTVREAGRILICGGIVDLYEDRDVGHLWSLFAQGADRHMLRLHRIAQRLIEVSGKHLLVATTHEGYAPGCRWLAMLGFAPHPEPLPDFAPDGSPQIAYTRTL